MTVALAAIDLGTTHLRVAAALPGAAPVVLADLPNRVRRGPGGAVRCAFAPQWSAVRTLLAALGAWSRQHGVERIELGLCGQVSSLLPWDAGATRPLTADYPIWQDATCAPALPRLRAAWADGADRVMLGTALVPATNWLATKLLHAGATSGACHVQLADAMRHRLTGRLVSHPSAQISLVDHRSGDYAPAMLALLGLDRVALPPIDAAARDPLLPALADAAGLPATWVHAPLADTPAALAGLAADGCGLLLLGTSEIAGLSHASEPPAPDRAVRIRLGERWFTYGSSASGGATVAWLVGSLLRRRPRDLAALTAAAEAIAPGCDGLLCLPYPDGERTPLWDAAVSGSFLGLRGHHTDAHLFRAVLEGVACARRQAAEAVGPLPPCFHAAGGGANNRLWNHIRAAVLERPLAVLPGAEPALTGAMRHAAAVAGLPNPADPAAGERIDPDPAWIQAYAAVRARFRTAQQTLHPSLVLGTVA
jgi:sugar (pentulose or hexulose) kinase